MVGFLLLLGSIAVYHLATQHAANSWSPGDPTTLSLFASGHAGLNASAFLHPLVRAYISLP